MTDEISEEFVLPAEQWRLLGTILWSGVIFVVIMIIQLAVILIDAFTQNHFSSEAEFIEYISASGSNGSILSIATMITTIVGCGLIAVIIKLKQDSQLTDYLCLRLVSGKLMLRWIAVFTGFLILTEILNLAVDKTSVTEFMLTSYTTTNPLWMIWVAMVIAAPVFEEVFFRGFLFAGIESSILGPIGAIIVTALIWAVIHLQYGMYEIGIIFIFGIVLGVSRLYTRSLLVPVVLHTINNFVATLQVALV